MCGWFANHKALCKDKIVSFASLGLDVQKKKKRQGGRMEGFITA